VLTQNTIPQSTLDVSCPPLHYPRYSNHPHCKSSQQSATARNSVVCFSFTFTPSCQPPKPEDLLWCLSAQRLLADNTPSFCIPNEQTYDFHSQLRDVTSVGLKDGKNLVTVEYDVKSWGGDAEQCWFTGNQEYICEFEFDCWGWLGYGWYGEGYTREGGRA
jgi:hypothetical protein